MKIIIKLIAVMILLSTVFSCLVYAEDNSDPPGKVEVGDYSALASYGSVNIPPDEIELLDDLGYVPTLKILYCFATDYLELGPKIEDYFWYFQELSGDKAYICEHDGSYSIVIISDYYNGVPHKFSSHETTDVMLKTVFRKDLFSCVEVTQNLEDIEVLNIYCLDGMSDRGDIIILFKTNHGDFVFYKDITGEYLFTESFFYENVYAGFVNELIKNNVDLSQYVVGRPSEMISMTEIFGEEPPESSETPPASSEITPPESSEITPPESSEITPPASSEITPPESSEITPPASSEITPPESSEITPPESSEITAPESSVTQTQSVPEASSSSTSSGGNNGTASFDPIHLLWIIPSVIIVLAAVILLSKKKK